MALLERLGFRVRPRKLGLEEAEEDYQAVVAYQGAMAYVDLADRSPCARPGQRCDWRRPPRLEEDVLPVARAFFLASEQGSSLNFTEEPTDIVGDPGVAPAAGHPSEPISSGGKKLHYLASRDKLRESPRTEGGAHRR